MTYRGHADQKFGPNTYSQQGEDLLFCNLAKHHHYSKTEPLWLDVGAHHPVNISNTHLLYMQGFKGVNVEANPVLIPELIKYRPSDQNVNVAVAVQSGRVPFYMFDDHSGRNTCSPVEVSQYQRDSGKPVEKTIQVPSLTLGELVQKFCKGVWPPFLFMDIEGLDYEVVSMAAEIQSRYACVETRDPDVGLMERAMKRHGYAPLIRLGENSIFQKL